MAKYQEDILYTIASQSEVHQGRPSDSEGQEGEERWCFIDGKGLFHAKKYGGEWRFMFYTNENITEGEQSSTGVTTTITEVNIDNADFDDITVKNSSTLKGSTSISGSSFNVANNIALTSFPHGTSLKIDGSSDLDAIQDIRPAASPTFDKLSITSGINATGSTYSAVSNTQWGYLGNMDQDVTTESNVQYAKLTLTDSSKDWTIDPENSGHLRITTADTADAAIIIGSNSDDDHTLKNHGYVSGMFTGQGWSIYEDNNRHKLEVDDLSVRGTLSVYELLIQQIRATNGAIFVTSAAKIETDGTNLYHSTGGMYTLTFKSDEENDKPHPFADGDLILARRVEIGGDTTDIVSEVRFTVIDASAGNHNQLSASSAYSSLTLPSENAEFSSIINGFDFVRVGNTTDANRRGGLYLTSDDTLAPFLDIFDGVSSWQEWDGITSIFGLGDNSFDLATVGEYTDDPELIPGSKWYAHTNGSAKTTIVNTGGIQNHKYCLLTNTGGGGTAFVYQDITFPYSSGSYEVLLEWYGKKTLSNANHPRIAIRELFPSGASQKHFQADGTLTTSGSQFITWMAITSPTNPQDNVSTVWHKYQWKLTVPNSLFDNTDNKTMKLVFSSSIVTGDDAWIDDVNISIEDKVKIRLGRLEGIGRQGYGLYAENAYLRGFIEADSGYIGNEYAGWRIESTGLVNEADQSFISAGQGASVGYENPGTYLDGQGRLFLGNATSYLKFDPAANSNNGVLTLSGKMIAGSVESDDGNTIFDLDNDELKIKMAGSADHMIKVGSGIDAGDTADQIKDEVILGSWAGQTNNAPAGQGILVKHTNSDDYTTINIGGIHRRNYPYPITVYQGFHWGGPTAFGVVDNAAYPSIYPAEMWDSTYHGTRTVYEANSFRYNNNDSSNAEFVKFETYGANVGYFLTAGSYGSYPNTIPSGRKLIIQISNSSLYIPAQGVLGSGDNAQLVTLYGYYGGPKPGKYSDGGTPLVHYTLFHNDTNWSGTFLGGGTWVNNNSDPYNLTGGIGSSIIDAGTIGTADRLETFILDILDDEDVFIGEIPSGTSVNNLYFINATATKSVSGGDNYWIGNYITILETDE